MNILITGGTGFLGTALIQSLLSSDQHQITVFSRSAKTVKQKFANEVVAVTDFDALTEHPPFDAVINLAGAPIFGKRWTDERKQVMRDSRIALTDQLISALGKMQRVPKVFISGSAIGIYGDQGDMILTENSQGKNDFSQQLCADWEASALKAEQLGARVCLIRTGLVIGNNGGLLQRMLLPYKLYLGGPIGNGKQWMSWIHLKDWVSIATTLLHDSTMKGAYNATAPNPVMNADFSASLAKALHRIAIIPAPAIALKLILGEMAELILGSQRVIPERLTAKGYKFSFTDLDTALLDIISKQN
jgi:uncharacterized protein